MSLKKKKTAQKKVADIVEVRPKGVVAVKPLQPVSKNQSRTAFYTIGMSFSVLLDRTKAFFKPAERVDV